MNQIIFVPSEKEKKLSSPRYFLQTPLIDTIEVNYNWSSVRSRIPGKKKALPMEPLKVKLF